MLCAGGAHLNWAAALSTACTPELVELVTPRLCCCMGWLPQATFGAEFDPLANDGTLIVPDLLGFGRSLDESLRDFSAERHLDALDHLLDELGVGDRPVVVGAHSMGCALALRWAARRGGQIRRIVGWAPVCWNAAGVEAELASMGAMARLFAGNTRAAEWACQLNCRHRTLAGWAAAPTHDSCRPVPGAVAERSLTQIPSLTTSGLGSGHAVQLTWPSCHRVSCESA